MKRELTAEQLDRIDNIIFELSIEDIRRVLRDLSIDELIVLHGKATNLAAKQMKITDAVIYGLAVRKAAALAKEMEDKLNSND